MDLLKKLYLVMAENIKRAKERRDPTGQPEVELTFKVNGSGFGTGRNVRSLCTQIYTTQQSLWQYTDKTG